MDDQVGQMGDIPVALDTGGRTPPQPSWLLSIRDTSYRTFELRLRAVLWFLVAFAFVFRNAFTEIEGA